MIKFKNFLLDKNSSINDAVMLIRLNNKRTIFINDKKKIVGVVSAGDILNALLYKKNLQSPVNKIMNKSFKFLHKKDLTLAKKYFIEFEILLLPIVNKKMELKDLITLNDILKY